MKQSLLISALLCATLFSCKETMKEKEEKQQEGLQYPETRKEEVVDDYFGHQVDDPYRWLEDDNSAETKAWVEAENKVTHNYLAQIPFREKIKARLTELWDYPKVSAPFKKGNYYYEFRNTGLQAQSVLYQLEGLQSEGKVFLDPNTFSEDGTVSLAGMAFSDDNKYMAYGISRGGSDWNEWFVMDIESQQLLNDKIEWTKFGGVSWFGEDGFFYTKFPQPKEGEALSGANKNGNVYYHKLGTVQSADLLIWEDPANPSYYNFGATTEDNKFFVLNQSKGTHGENLLVLPLSTPDKLVAKPRFISIVSDFENDHSVLDNEGNTLIVRTNYQAPNYRLVKINVSKPAKDQWTDLLPEGESVLQGASICSGKLFASYLQDASDRIYIFDLEGNKTGEVELPTIGSVGGFGGKREDSEIFYSFTSYTYPSSVFRYDVATNTSTMYKQSEVKFNPADYETKEVFYDSKDGEKVHMFITHRKDLQLDGQRPTLLYAYGGFNISLTPSFSVANIVLLENGGVFCVANLRGGGEYGEEWHKAGMLLNKQNVFNDFIAAGEYLIQSGYTSKEKLAIRGGSNGGLLVGACMVQRPDLFKVAFPAVGVLDMLRYHKFTVGAGWAVEYGSSDEEEHFNNLIKYSPYHNLKPNTEYPATMVMTADHDDRVVPAHSFKFAARLQEYQTGSNPVLINIETQAGHGAGKSTQQVIDEYADIWSFMFYNMGIDL
ncbi:prolyl oligopeptidase family serine peptidase [bacterium]|nr:prolyl oligopeptidase family serine peptidase [bacterium]